MAKIIEELVVLKFSKVVKDSSSDAAAIVDSEVKAAIEQVAQELLGDNIIVEVVTE